MKENKIKSETAIEPLFVKFKTISFLDSCKRTVFVYGVNQIVFLSEVVQSHGIIGNKIVNKSYEKPLTLMFFQLMENKKN